MAYIFGFYFNKTSFAMNTYEKFSLASSACQISPNFPEISTGFLFSSFVIFIVSPCEENHEVC